MAGLTNQRLEYHVNLHHPLSVPPDLIPESFTLNTVRPSPVRPSLLPGAEQARRIT